MQPVKMTDELIRDIMQEFYSQASTLGNLQTDKFSFNKNFSKSAKDAVEVNFTLEAYHEMCALIDHFSTEVAWHGLVKRIDKTHFQIFKILVYPQKVTGGTVNTDQSKYAGWRDNLDNDSFNSLRFQGHSHVNMSTTPSSVDMDKQWEMIDSFNDNTYYIFMIWNKRREYNVRVVDMADNIIYSGDDVKVTIGDLDMKGFLEEAKALVEESAPPTYNYNYGSTYGANAKTYPGGSFVGSSSTATAKTAETKPSNPTLRTVTGAAAPKVNKENESNLMGYYKKNPNELADNWNFSCLPYADALSN